MSKIICLNKWVFSCHRCQESFLNVYSIKYCLLSKKETQTETVSLMPKRTVIKYASYSSTTNETLWGIFVNWFLYTINNIYKQEIYHFIALEAWIIPGVLKLGTWLGMA